MKIFHIGICVGNKYDGQSRALKKVCDEYAECRPEIPDSQILGIFNEFKPDLVFMQIQSKNVIGVNTIGYMAQRSRLINWTGDIRNHIDQWYFQWAPYVVTCFSNERDVNEFKGRNFISEFLQIGIDTDVFKSSTSSTGSDIVFMANYYGNMFPLSGERKYVADLLRSRYNGRFKLFGTGWPRSDGNLNDDHDAQAKFYYNSKIAINHSSFNVERYTSDRLFRILASGCFCLSHHYKGIDKDFIIGEHLVTYLDSRDLIQKIERYLADEPERKRIAKSGQEYVHANFSYDNMAQNIVRIYNQYK